MNTLIILLTVGIIFIILELAFFQWISELGDKPKLTAKGAKRSR
jgi:hypothetical protein